MRAAEPQGEEGTTCEANIWMIKSLKEKDEKKKKNCKYFTFL